MHAVPTRRASVIRISVKEIGDDFGVFRPDIRFAFFDQAKMIIGETECCCCSGYRKTGFPTQETCISSKYYCPLLFPYLFHRTNRAAYLSSFEIGRASCREWVC